MAGVGAIYSVGQSLVSFLKNAYQNSPLATATDPDEGTGEESGTGETEESTTPTFDLISSSELASMDSEPPKVTLYLYRVSVNEQVRNVASSKINSTAAPFSLNLHYLLTVWAATAYKEHTLLAWAMHQLHLHPILDLSVLDESGEWEVGDMLHLIPEELSNEDLMRIWDAVEPSYRISFPYIVRVVRIDPDTADGDRPVVAKRFSYETTEGEM